MRFKKLTALLLTGAMVLSMAACGGVKEATILEQPRIPEQKAEQKAEQ